MTVSKKKRKPLTPKKILMLFDLHQEPPEDHDYRAQLKTDDWFTELSVYRALKRLGHEVSPFGIHDRIEPLLSEIRGNRPDLIFNLCESFCNDREYEPNIVALLELLKMPYTGAPPGALSLCKDKGMTKKILTYHRVRVPRFVVSRKGRPLKRFNKFQFPAFIKPLGLEGSEGIAQMSFVDNEKDCLERVSYIHESLQVDAIIEEYIEGRELYVGCYGTGRVQLQPPRELHFYKVPEGEPKFATFKAKWDKKYRKKWGIRSGPPKEIEPATQRKIDDICKKVYRIFGLSGYARIDLRLKDNGDVVFIEANPNPSLAEDEDFARGAKQAGMEYDQLIDEILRMALRT